LAESETVDAVRPDEFRQRFAAAAAVKHPHVAATLEVLEVQGRPAALTEWLSGLPATEWPALAAAPGVWFRLVCQAALGLRAAHEAGLVHGHLDSRSIVFTADGTVKVTGLGEPPWLIGHEAWPEGEDGVAADLAALGRTAEMWAAQTAKKKPAKPLPGELHGVLQRLQPEAGAERIASAAELLEELDKAGADLPSSAEAWERLLRHVGENATEGEALRKSA
jgi:hypothetical protein